jgi:hypothetical protein
MLRFPNHDEHPAILLLKIPPDYSTSGASGSLSGLEWRYVLPAMIERIVTGWTESLKMYRSSPRERFSAGDDP